MSFPMNDLVMYFYHGTVINLSYEYVCMLSPASSRELQNMWLELGTSEALLSNDIKLGNNPLIIISQMSVNKILIFNNMETWGIMSE